MDQELKTLLGQILARLDRIDGAIMLMHTDLLPCDQQPSLPKGALEPDEAQTSV
ncbi:hypothetical protein BJY21_004193 [Kineosphaera limosa]|uniref:Uncharacterized protein n=1 Tax=Kineosphaera limosa NBRC 100340 TaxID=1184609 RepID=K6VFY2_9MICO|nr:hypothetical protein [Kineosphaera limosa]NYE03009.1 hypothetical protein [Kineosphaera limosa]GAB95098.1 hypothetical protein KILIM_016_00380 [Kineosphaera limosa NBRC 100340]